MKPHLWLIQFVGLIVPRRLRADWRQEWEAELRFRELLLADWDKLNWKTKLDLLRRSLGAFWDALLLQPARLEDEMFQDLRYGARMLLKQPGFTVVAVLTLALGIGANTAIFSVVNGVLLKALPFPDPERLVIVSEASNEMPVMSASYQNYLDWRTQQTVFENIAALMPAGGVLAGAGEPERVIGRWVTASFFPTLGVRPQIGRFFKEAEDQPGAERVIVLSHVLWERSFGGNPDVVGKAIRYNAESWTVIGVTPPRFDFYGQTNLNNDFFIPIAHLTAQPYMRDRHSHPARVIARMKPDVTLELARAEMTTIAARLERQYPESNEGNGVALRTLLDDYVGDVRVTLLVIYAAVALLLLIASVNVANLMLARAATRQKEIAVRMALGAGRVRIVRQVLTESIMLAAAGGVGGLLLAVGGIRAIVKLNPDGLPRLEDISVEPWVLAYTLLVTLLTAVVFGLAPALHCARVSVNDVLKKGGRRSSGGVQRVRGALVVAEVALSLVLLVGAGLLVKSDHRLMGVDSGFEARNVLTIRLRLPDAKYAESAQTTAFLKEVMRRVARLASVEQVSVATGFPLGRGSETGYWIEGQPEPRHPGDWHVAIRQSVSENYHRTLGVRLLAGRYFTEYDIADSALVVIVDEDFVRRHFPDRSIDGVLGERLRFGGDGEAWREVVGVVRHVRHYGLDEEARAEIYRPWLQIGARWLADSTRTLDLIVKTSTAPENLVGAIKQEVQTLDPEQPLGNVATLDSLLDRSVAPRRFSLMLLGLFAGVALLLAAVGLFGVMSYAVTRRTREIGIRLALGAQGRDVLSMVVKQGLMLSLSGAVVGLAGSFALTRLMTSMLFGVSATDPAIFAAITLLLVGVALAACYIPARRATKVDPILALRHE